MSADELTPLQAHYIAVTEVGLAMGGTVAVLLAVVLGMAFVRAVW